MTLRFEWDQRMAASNFAKHGVSFEEATSVFKDTLSATLSDPDHSFSDSRFVDLGISYLGRLIVVSYVEGISSIRIISARRATRLEQNQYENESG
ncbi:MAG: BrnT family toxin [Bryobacterales bacterium]